MNSASEVCERTVVIQNEYGLHARPAAEFAKLASRFASEISVLGSEMKVNGKSIMGVMMLAAECGSEITVHAEGEDAETAVDQLAELVNSGFGEAMAE